MRWLVGLAVKRGLPAWVIPLLIYVFVAALVAWLCSYIYDSGVISERERWQAKENAELVKRQQKILELTSENRELERKRVLEQSQFVQRYQELVNNENNRTKAVLADVAAQRKRLSISTKTVRACSDSASGIPAATYRGSATEDAELSDQAAQFLVGLASEADQVVHQLTLCQTLLNEKRGNTALAPSVSVPE